MNPTSAAAALQALAGLGGAGRRIVVFGQMRELGEQSVALHRALGAEVARMRQEVLVCVGEGAAAIADGALQAGLSPAAAHCVAGHDDAFGLLLSLLQPGDRVLCKASRAVQLDRLVDRLVVALAGRTATAAMEQS
jgi:UDP-N-acetylmuramoyl-tripeptide--D-alanyl-D-alanine ligase